ncbi:hypothetical protein [Methylibium petroleiphilum]|uniref:hypothetical protein n=1 Tax=Methylibium petroleiphilum TaxID=105560 RepID=UPI003D27AF03
MLGATGFFTFTHVFEASNGDSRTIAFAYKPPGPALEGAVEELILEVSKGPIAPDAVVLLEISEDSANSIRDALAGGANELAQTRIAGRIPLVHATLSLTSGKVRAKLLDLPFTWKSSELLEQVRKHVSEWTLSGLRCVFKPEVAVLLAPPGYAYQKPSGSRERFFLKPDLALSTSASVAFVALALFLKLFAGRLHRVGDLRSVYLDTMAIAPVAYGLRDLLDLCRAKQAYLIESFHSYGGMEMVKRPLPGTSICLISASSSMSLQERWLIEKEAGADEVVTLLTVKPVSKLPEGALFAIDRPKEVASQGPPQLSIHLKGETFLPVQEPAKKVLLSEVAHGSIEEVRHFKEFAGTGVFDVYRRPVAGTQRVRAFFVDGQALIGRPEFGRWLETQLLHRARAATKVILHQDDPSSKALAGKVAALCASQLGLKTIQPVAATTLHSMQMPSGAGVIICATVVGKGSKLLEISRALRDKHDGPRLYVVGYQVAEARDELKTLPSNLKHSKDVAHEFVAFGAVAVGNQLAQSYADEVDAYYPSSVKLSGLTPQFAKRAKALGSVDPVGARALLPCGSKTDAALQIRPGFAYWPKGYAAQPCQAEILGTLGALLQRAREHDKVPEEQRLSSSSFRHVLLHPENFTRFNDGVLQAALLRNAYPSEIDYRGDYAASDFMKALVIRALARATEESGEVILEFLLALALRRLQLAEVHLDEVLAEASSAKGRPATLQRAINFVLRPLTGKGESKQVLPF